MSKVITGNHSIKHVNADSLDKSKNSVSRVPRQKRARKDGKLPPIPSVIANNSDEKSAVDWAGTLAIAYETKSTLTKEGWASLRTFMADKENMVELVRLLRAMGYASQFGLNIEDYLAEALTDSSR